MWYWATKTMNKIYLESSMSLTQSYVLRTFMWSNLDWQRGLAVQESSHNEKLLREEKNDPCRFGCLIENRDLTKIWTTQKCSPQAEIQILEEMRTVFSEVRIFWGPHFPRPVFPSDVRISSGPNCLRSVFSFWGHPNGYEKELSEKFNNLHQDASLRNCIELFHSGFSNLFGRKCGSDGLQYYDALQSNTQVKKIIHTQVCGW